MLPVVLPVVLYNGTAPWLAAREVAALIAPVRPRLAPCQPAQRCLVLDARHVAQDDLPPRNLLRAVVGLEQSGAPVDLLRVVEALQGWFAGSARRRLEARIRGLGTADGSTAGTRRRGVTTAAYVGGCEDDVGRTRGRVARAVAPGGPPGRKRFLMKRMRITPVEAGAHAR